MAGQAINEAALQSGLLLVRYDATVAHRATAAAFTSWRDRLLLVLGGVLVIAASRTWFEDHSASLQRWAVMALGAGAGLACGRAVIARLRHHAADGPLAVAALHPASRLRYVVIGHAAAAAATVVVVAVARPRLIGWSLAAYSFGAGLALLAPGFDKNWNAPDRVRRRLSTLGESYSASGLAAAAFVTTAAVSRAFPGGAQMAAIGIAASLPMLVLTAIDDPAIRFMAMTGHSVAASVGRRGRAGAIFTAIATVAALLAAGFSAAALVLAIGLATLALLTLRVVLYRLYSRRIADLVLAGIAAATALLATSLPIALPFVAAIFISHLWRRAAKRCWLIA